MLEVLVSSSVQSFEQRLVVGVARMKELCGYGGGLDHDSAHVEKLGFADMFEPMAWVSQHNELPLQRVIARMWNPCS